MATITTHQDEPSIPTNSAEPQSPSHDSAITAVDEDERYDNGKDYHKADLENNSEADIWKAERAGEGYFVPLRIWCASVLFPLCAGCFGPMVSAFGICALVESWRVDNVTEAADKMLQGSDIRDPKW
jgi:potassium channel subfamily K